MEVAGGSKTFNTFTVLPSHPKCSHLFYTILTLPIKFAF